LSSQILNKDEVMGWLHEIPDPEIPVISIVELGVIRDLNLNGTTLEVTITPTYSGCPAMKQMEEDVIKKLNEKGFSKINIVTVYDPAWTTDWISAEARLKLQNYGIAPPEGSKDKTALMGEPKSVTCPRCKSKHSEMVSQFGSTACKALYKCKDCLEVFDYFKCI
jgi:ring-1,2-phenylacetyl-CoA epoxidase subunit PaaD